MLIKSSLVVALVLLASLAWPPRLAAQFIGYVSGQTVQQRVFTNQAANGSSPTLRNLGNAAHFLTYCNTGFSGTITFQASPDGSFVPPIPLASASYGQQTNIDTGCHVLQVGGYFPTFRATISNYAAGSVNAWYSASGMPIVFQPAALGTNGPTAPVACDQTAVGAAASGTTVPLVSNHDQISTGIIYVCQITFSFDAATTTSAINVFQSTDGTCTATGTVVWTWNITATTPQTLNVGAPMGAFMRTLQPGRCLLISAGTITAGVHYSVSFAVF